MKLKNWKKCLVIIILVGFFFGLIYWPRNHKNTKNNSPQSFLGERKEEKDFVNNLQLKGYSQEDSWCISQNFHRWGWKLEEQLLPNLNSQKRIGTIKVLAYTLPQNEYQSQFYKQLGKVHELIIIVREKLVKNPKKPIINIDYRLNSNDYTYYKNIVNFGLTEHDNQQLEIGILFSSLGDKKIEGESAGISAYLALLSSLWQIPLSEKVATTGRFKNGKVGGAMGLETKVIAASRRGVNRLVLDKCSNYYQNTIPSKIRKNIIPFFVGDYRELQGLLRGGELS